MLRTFRQAWAWLAYRIIRTYWWMRRPVILGVRVLVTDSDEVLLVKHSYREGWFLPGGTPEAGESLPDTARRETQEETGVLIDDLALLGIYSSVAGPESDHVAVFRCVLQDSRANQEKGSVEWTGGGPEVEEVQWASVAHLPQEATEQTRCILRDWRREETRMYRVLDEKRTPGTQTL